MRRIVEFEVIAHTTQHNTPQQTVAQQTADLTGYSINCPLCQNYIPITLTKTQSYYAHCYECQTTIFFTEHKKAWCIHGEFTKTKKPHRLFKRCYMCHNTIFVNLFAFKQLTHSNYVRDYNSAHIQTKIPRQPKEPKQLKESKHQLKEPRTPRQPKQSRQPKTDTDRFDAGRLVAGAFELARQYTKPHWSDIYIPKPKLPPPKKQPED